MAFCRLSYALSEDISYRGQDKTETTVRSYLLIAHLVSDGFLGWEVEGVHLRELRSQVVVELPELGVTPVHIPLVVQDTDVDLRTQKTRHRHDSQK